MLMALCAGGKAGWEGEADGRQQAAGARRWGAQSYLISSPGAFHALWLST
ncbi:MAG: hypothetical protein Kow00124_02590 [Anaerolineae bacterium]